MSILLRKEAQSILDENNLSDLHAEINSNKNLQLQTVCGKPYITLEGVRFASNRPTKEEIQYSTKLLEEFLIGNKILIQNLRKAEQTYRNTSLPTIDNSYVEINRDEVTWRSHDLNIEVIVNVETKEPTLHLLDRYKGTQLRSEDLLEIEITVTPTLCRLVDKTREYNKIQDTYDEYKLQLTKCDI